MADDNVQYGIDDDPRNDPEKGAALGGLGGAAVGAAAGSLAGPLGTIVGAVAGGLIGAGASGAAVAAIDAVDKDDTITGIGNDDDIRAASAERLSSSDGVLYSSGNEAVLSDGLSTGIHGHNVVTGEPAATDAGTTGLATGAVAGGLIGTVVGGPVGAVIGGTLGSLAGGVAGDAAEVAGDETTIGTSARYGEHRTGNYADDNAYSGAAFQADALTSPDINPAPLGNTAANDDVLSPSTQTDYRNVDSGFTSIGATDENADVSSLEGLSTPGVRTGSDVSIGQTGGTTSGSDVGSGVTNDPTTRSF